MEDGNTLFQGVTLTPRSGVGFITDAKLLKFSSPFPQSPTRLIGGELSLDFGKRKNNDFHPVGELAFLYYWGKAQDQFDQSDLPLANNPLSDLIRFSNKREATSHTLLGEWRWPSFSPLYSSRRWGFIHPQFGLGAGGIYFNTKITQGTDNPIVREKSELAMVATGSTRVQIVQFSTDHFRVSLDGAVRLFAGEAFGMLGEGGLRLSWKRF